MSPLAESRLVAGISLALNLLTALAAAALVAVPVVAALVAIGVFDAGDGRPVETLLRLEVVAEAADPAAAATRELRMQGESTLRVPGDRAFLASLGAMELLGLIGLVALLNFRRLFVALRKGAAFGAGNAKYLRQAGYAIVAWQLLAPPLQYAVGRIALADVPSLPAAVSLHPALQLSVGGLLAGLALLVLAELLREAAEMKQDNELTV